MALALSMAICDEVLNLILGEIFMSFLQRLADKIHEIKTHSENRKDFSKALLNAVRDGVLTDAEITELNQLKEEYGLTENDLKKLRVKAYETAYVAAKADGVITSEEEADLSRIQKYLGVQDYDIKATKSELLRLRLIDEINHGNLPIQTVSNVVIQRGEVVHWEEQGNILEERVVSKHYVGGSNGVSFRIAKGVSYRIGASRGHIVTDKAIVPISTGRLIFTNKRILFAGDRKSFALSLNKILNIDFFSDGLQLHATTGKPRIIQITQPAHIDIIGAVISATINGYS